MEFRSTDTAHTVQLHKDVYVDTVLINKPNVAIQNDVVIFAQESVTATDSSINLNNHSLAFNQTRPEQIVGVARLIDPNPAQVVFSGDAKVQLTVDNSSAGQLLAQGSQSEVDMNNKLNSMTIFLTDKTSTLPQAGGVNYPIFNSASGGRLILPDNGKVTFSNSLNPFAIWTYNDGVLTATAAPNPEQIIVDIIGNPTPSQVTNIPIILGSGAQSDLIFAAQQLAALELLLAIESNSSITNSTTETLGGLVNAFDSNFNLIMNNAIALLANRMDSKEGIEIADANDKVVSDRGDNPYGLGIAAGSNNRQYGAWLSGFLGSDHQKAIDIHPGFKAKTWGTTIGVDTELEFAKLAGVAFSFASAKIDHRDANIGDKTKSKNYIASLYGVHELNDKWSVDAVLSFMRSNIDNQEQRKVRNSPVIAQANYNASSVSFETSVNYDTLLSQNVAIIPSVGLGFTRNFDFSYLETGASNQNLYVQKKSENIFEALAGTQIVFVTEMNNMTLAPEVHGELRYDFSKKRNLISSVLPNSNQSLVQTGASVERFKATLGLGAALKGHMTEFSVSYDMFLAKKYFGQQGTFTVKLKF